jgi:hypothetical protein
LGEDRSILRHFVEDFGSRPGNARLEAPWTEHTGEELTQWITSRARVDEFWRSSNTLQPHVRLLGPISFDDSPPPILLPGGRWLIGTQDSQEEVNIYALDLDSPLAEPDLELVISAKMDVEANHCVVHWIDYSQPRLTFRIAIVSTIGTFAVSALSLVSQWPLDRGLEPTMPVHIYHVEVEGHGQEAKLVSRHLTTLYRACPGRFLDAGLDGENFIEIRRLPGSIMTVIKYWNDRQPIPQCSFRPLSVEIFPAKTVSLPSVPQMSVCMTCHKAGVQILWGTHIIVFTEDAALIWSIDQIKRSDPESESVRGEWIQPLHSLHTPWARTGSGWDGCPFNVTISAFLHSLSHPARLDDAVQYTFAVHNKIFGLHIPRNLGIAPQLLHLLDEPNTLRAPVGTGYLRSILVHEESIVAISHMPDVWDNSPQSRTPLIRKVYNGSWKPVDNFLQSACVGYSEELGRIIVMCRHHYVLIELA